MQPSQTTENADVSIRRRGVVAVVLNQGRLLVIQRSAEVVAPGAYCFPGGGIEGDESEPEALVREIQEELRVEVVPLRRVWHSVTPWGVELFWWLSQLPADARLDANPAEVAGFDWYAPEPLRQLPGLLASNVAFLEALAAGEISLTVN